MNRRRRWTSLGILALALCVAPLPARAQWSRVEEVPVARVFSIWTHGDTLAAGADTCVDLSTDAGASWRTTTRPAAGVKSIQAVRIHGGRLFAGTFGQGVFVSDDLGAHWQDFNQGLFGTQRFVVDLVVNGDSLYAATAGAGVVVRRLAGAGSWQPFGDAFEANEDPNVNSVGFDGSRLVAAAGGNGLVYHRDPGESDWTTSPLDNIGLHPGLQGGEVTWTGESWLVGTIRGVFRSAEGREPWTLFDPGLGPLTWIAFANSGHGLVGAFTKTAPRSATIAESSDDGASWKLGENLPGVLVHQLAFLRGTLYAGREDGLWREDPVAAVPPPSPRNGLGFAVASAQPVGDHARLRFALAEPAQITIEVFDASGRRAAEPIRAGRPAGPGEASLDLGALPSGVYLARLHTGHLSGAARLVHVR